MTEERPYVLGSSEPETQRLIRQADLYEPMTRRFLSDAGVSEGMTVLDVGSGAGDVAFMAADLVGPSGIVVGVEINADVSATARSRAGEQGRSNVNFVVGNVHSAEIGRDFDAAIGRFVAMHSGDVDHFVQALAGRVRMGGIVALAEGDLSMGLGYGRQCGSEVIRSAWEWTAQAFEHVGIPLAMAPVLRHAFAAAGLGDPHMCMHAPLGSRADWPGFEIDADTMRSMAPMFEEHGIVDPATLDADTLAMRFRAETNRTGYPFLMLPLVTAWAAKPK